MKNLIARFVREEEGQDLIEYALLIVFIALVVVAALGPLGTQVKSVYTTISSSLAS
jgi:pilus assembly protein Flp/PilA